MTNTATLTTRKVHPGLVQLMRGEEVLGSVSAVSTGGRLTGQWIVSVGGRAIWGKRYASGQLAMNALVNKVSGKAS